MRPADVLNFADNSLPWFQAGQYTPVFRHPAHKSACPKACTAYASLPFPRPPSFRPLPFLSAASLPFGRSPSFRPLPFLSATPLLFRCLPFFSAAAPGSTGKSGIQSGVSPPARRPSAYIIRKPATLLTLQIFFFFANLEIVNLFVSMQGRSIIEGIWRSFTPCQGFNGIMGPPLADRRAISLFSFPPPKGGSETRHDSHAPQSSCGSARGHRLMV